MLLTKMENKIAILINWPREIDMYDRLIKVLPNQKLEIIINDIKTIEKGRNKLFKSIQKILIKKKIKYKFFSEIYKKKKYKVLISTGEACSQKITLISIFKFMHAKTLGLILKKTNLYKIFLFLFNRPFTAEFNKNRIGSVWYPEKEIGKKVIKFPDGMDLKIKNYPHPEYENVFDVFLTLGKYETKIIKKKFKNKKCLEIGYLRYENLNRNRLLQKKIYNEFKLNKKKGIVFWTPTHVDGTEEAENINLWYEKINELNKMYNVIIRPHPKTLMIMPELEKKLRKFNYFIDKEQNRKIGEIYKISDFVVSDYGGTIFSAIYFQRPILILNLKQKSHFVENLRDGLSLDISVRKELLNLNPSISVEKIKKIPNLILNKKYKKKIEKLKKNYFGLEKRKKINYLRNYLLNNV